MTKKQYLWHNYAYGNSGVQLITLEVAKVAY